jgi:hypothetical protein
MQLHRILVVYSTPDWASQRIRQAETNPALKDIEFRHFSVIDPARGSRLAAELDAFTKDIANWSEIRERELIGEIILSEVKPLLLAEIREFRPDVLLIHGGTVFRAATAPFLQMLIDIQRDYPNLPYALEGKERWCSWVEEVEYPRSPMVVRAQIRWVRRNFVDDSEVDAIIDELF